MSRILVTLIALATTACGSKNDYPDCGEPSAIASAAVDGELALPKGVETDIALTVLDAEGDLCDPSDLALAFDDPGQIEVVATGETTILKPRYDAIDLGTEPTTVMHASLGDLHASWTVASVVDLGGAWNVVITEATRYPDGFDFGEVTFTQHGRAMTWEDCSISLVCERDAVIAGADFTVEAPDIGLTIAAPISADRRSFSGPWSAKDGDYSGTFSAERVD